MILIISCYDGETAFTGRTIPVGDKRDDKRTNDSAGDHSGAILTLVRQF